MADTQLQLLLQAARAAVQEHQTGKLATSVEEILHLEKRWNKLPGSSAGSVSLEDATALLGTEVLEGEPLEFVVRRVFAGAAPPEVLTKRQFLALAHVAEVAQGKAFDLLSAEDALRSQPTSASHKKRPPTIRDSHIEEWQIAASPGPPREAAQAGGRQPEPAAAAPLAAEPGPLGGGHLSRATSLRLPEGPLRAGVRALSRQNSADDLAAAVQLPPQPAQARQQHLSGATSYQSVEEYGEGAAAEDGEEDAGQAGAGQEPDTAVEEFTAKLNGLIRMMSGDETRLRSEQLPHTPEGMLAADTSAATAPAGSAEQVPPSGKTRSSWESFNSTPGAQAAATAAAQAQVDAQTPPQQAQQMNEAVISAAMAAGMTFMQHLQAAGAAGAAQPSPFADVNPLRQAATIAAAAAAGASPQRQGGAAFSPASPDVRGVSVPAQLPQQVIADMMARLSLQGASPAQLQAAVAALQARALQAQTSGSHQGSMGSSAASADRAQQQGARGEAWQPFDGEASRRAGDEAGRLARRQRAASAVPVSELAPPRSARIAGWEAMSGEDLIRCRTVFIKKGYPEVGGMQKHSAMEYFAKLRMEPHVFHAAWQAADLGADGRLDCREFCVFVQLLRGAQKGRLVPAQLSGDEAAALLGEAPMPAASAASPLHIDTGRLRSALAHSRQASLAGHEVAESVMQGLEDDDDASSIDSGIAESVSGLSVCSRPSYHPAHGPGLARPSTQPHTRTGLGSVLGGGAPSYHPAAARSERAGGGHAGGPGLAVHSLLELAVHSAVVKYRKTLSTPIFTVSVRDSLGRLVELPIDTHPGHYRKETSTIHSSAIVRLGTQLQHMPPGSTLFVEIKHWKSDKKRFSTLAWTAAPLEKVVDFGPAAARVRSGPADLPLFKKPLDFTLRRAKRLSRSNGSNLHLTMRGVE